MIPAIPALSFVLILAFGKRLPRGGSEIGIAAVGIAFVLALGTGVGWIQRVNHPPEVASHTTEEAVAAPAEEGGHGGEAAAAEEEEEEHHVVPPVVREVRWIDAGALGASEDVTVGTMVDGLSTLMLLVVTIVSLLVHIYSTDYVAGDRRYTHFFAFLSLFTASMLFFVLAQSTLQMIVGWELVGLCSFVLIGHWWEEKPNSDAALKAFLTNRVGDVGLLVGMIVLYFAAGRSFDIIQINEMADAGEIRHLLLLVASCCLMAAVMSKSGQFILHTWLPDAMAGPTPVSALIHAATMVVAGIYMIARLYSVFWEGFQIGDSNINLMAVIGAVTLVFGALLAFVQNDIKKVLAYSTISQLGYMVMALGVGRVDRRHLPPLHPRLLQGVPVPRGRVAQPRGAQLRHEEGHGRHAQVHADDLRHLRDRHARPDGHPPVRRLLVEGRDPRRGQRVGRRGRLQAHAGHGDHRRLLHVRVHDPDHLVRVLRRAEGRSQGAPAARVRTAHHRAAGDPGRPGRLRRVRRTCRTRGCCPGCPRASRCASSTSSSPPRPTSRAEWTRRSTTRSSRCGSRSSRRRSVRSAAFLAYLWFWKGVGPHGITKRSRAARAGYTVLENKYYLDFLYTDIIAGGTKGPIARAANWVNQYVIDGVVNLVGRSAVEGGQWVYKYIDQGVVDTIVNGSGATAEGSGQILRKQQTGKVQAYGAYLFAGATLLAAIFVAIASAN